MPVFNHIEIGLWKLKSLCRKKGRRVIASMVELYSAHRCQFDGPNRQHGLGDEGKAAGCLMAGGFAVFMGHGPMSLSLTKLFD